MLQLKLHSIPSSLSSSSSNSLCLQNHSFLSPKFLPFSSVTPKPFSITCRHSDLFDQKTFSSSAPSSSSSSSSGGALPPRVYVGHSIYKGKAALSITPRPPEFAPLDSGAFKISREGYVLLQFAPAIASRQYDWTRKQVFSLSVGEMGTVISLGARESCEFFHDPMKGKSDEGKVRKVLKVDPLPDGSGHMFNLSVQNRIVNVDENIYIPVSRAELTVLSSIFNFIMPYLLGWHTFANSIKPEDSRGANNANPTYGGDYEWNRL
ncbi:single-stranded DNA-binding protein WHY1, chloroplastic-like [Arachis stenosperma]|uniref:single-stranded DNA-binding protein WHY1, chloroplastic-like n=1 Tax=Arachis stenosperma TaxID=217475 RepID=UPI0025AC727A|nr:single-stranded DNA-binding protein WHY1, chloroplastic-like [Arachis stenosperma]